jgi:predicted O-methyltransferase YrrM
MNVNVLVRNLNEDRVIPRFAGYLRDGLGWHISNKPVKGMDAYYLSLYLEWSFMQPLPDRPVMAYFSHREENPVNGPKSRLFDNVASLVDLRIVTAGMYRDMLADCGPTVQIPAPVERERFTIPGKLSGRKALTAGFSGYVYGNKRKGEDLASRLVNYYPAVSWRASGRGWPALTRRFTWAEMPAFYQSLDILVITARVEGVPMPALEALACGVSVVVPRGVGLLDELPEIQGIHRYDRGDANDLIRAFGEATHTRSCTSREVLRAVTQSYTIEGWIQGHKIAIERINEEPMVKFFIGQDDKIMKTVRKLWPDVDAVLKWAAKYIPKIKRQVAEYQGAILAYYAYVYNKPSAKFLEIGTAIGYSACVMATAAPMAWITTLNPKGGEYQKAVKNLSVRSNVRVVKQTSEEFWHSDNGQYDMIFVDGDHRYAMVLHDAQFFNRLKPGGLIIFHDYSPDGSDRPSDGSYKALNDLAEKHRPFDVKVVGTGNVGMVGWIRQTGETW